MIRQFKSIGVSLLAVTALCITSCSTDDDNIPEPVKEGIQKASLTFTEVSGENVYPHGDHFHGLNGGVEGESKVIEFDSEGNATSGGHLHLEADAVYKIELKAWDYEGNEVQDEFLESKEVADNYKAFLIGGNYVLNPDTSDQTGAIFLPRDPFYGDGTAPDGKYETTGIISYFITGSQNEGEADVTYVFRKLVPGEKAKIERTDWNLSNYQSNFQGENVLELNFEIQASEGHDH